MARFSLTKKTFIFVVITLAVIVTLRVGSARLIILKEFAALEADLTRQNMERLLATIERQCQEMARLISDWGAWTDTVDFINGTNPEYAAINLTVDTFSNLDLHLIVLADTAKRFRWAGIYFPEAKALPSSKAKAHSSPEAKTPSSAEETPSSPNESLAPIAPAMRGYLKETQALWTLLETSQYKAGLLNTPMGLMLVAAGPILDSERQGPVAGTIIMARLFGPAAEAALKAEMQMEISIGAFMGDPSGIEDGARHHLTLTHSAVEVRELDKTWLRATTVLRDLTGNPAIELAAQMPRQIYAQGTRTIRLLLFWQAFSGVLVTLMVILFVRRVILLPIGRLNRKVSAIAARSSFSDRLEVTSRDEVGETSEAINQMLAALETTNTNLQAAYDELKATQSQLIQTARLASIGQLSAGVAHELNQPLMVIRGTAQMIKRSHLKGSLEPETLPVQLNLIERNTKRMMNIIDHLRAFSSQSNREHALADMNKVVKDCFVLLGKQLRVQGIDVELALMPNLPNVMCDRSQMEQVILNLITNAQDAILEKRSKIETEWQGRLTVMTALAASGRSAVEVRVRDNGSGISDDRLDWIFDPFFTTKAVGQGTGLGLSISYGIVQEHRGDLRVEATGPQGSTFVIVLPAAPGPSGPPIGDPAG